MNRGTIPGYYFDEEKKKYFKIQANHVAPVKSKYSKSNVKQEQRQRRETKRRKVDERRLRKQTVTIAQSLKHPLLTGCGLQREMGNRSRASYQTARDAAFVQSLEASSLQVEIDGFKSPGVTDAQRLPDDKTLLAITHSHGSHAVYLYDSISNRKGRCTLPSQQPVVAFPKMIVSMEAASISSAQYLLACGNQFSSSYYYFGNLDANPHAMMFPITELRSIKTLWASRMNPSMLTAAFTGTGAVLVTSIEASRSSVGKQALDDKSESFALDWLLPNILAFGVTREQSARDIQHTAYLWDVRIRTGSNVEASTARIKRPLRITGIKRHDESGHNLIVTSSRDINLYDLRMTSTDQPALLSIPHTSPGSQLVFDTQQQLFAAADQYDRTHVYSLRTGKRISSLPPPPTSDFIRSLRWQEDSRGSPYLQVCSGTDTIRTWAWNTESSTEMRKQRGGP